MERNMSGSSGNTDSSGTASLSQLAAVFAQQEQFELSIAILTTQHDMKMAAYTAILTGAQGIRGA
jgi:hypothetical protein